MKEIPLTQGLVALVDDADFEWLNQWKWQGRKGTHTNYAIRSDGSGEKRKTVLMHRAILGLTDSSIYVDHRDHNGLNNQRDNIRIATPSQNICNSQKRKRATSRFIGVGWKKTRGGKYNYWCARGTLNGKDISLGTFKIEEDAGRAYDEWAKEHYGEFANLNFK